MEGWEGMSNPAFLTPVTGTVKIDSKNTLLLISGTAEQFSDLRNVILPLAKSGKDGRSGQYLAFYKALLKTIPQS